MSDTLHYRVEDGAHLVEIDIASIGQLFNSLDPSPFREKDLDDDAEAYIVACAEEIPRRAPIRLAVYLPAAVAATVDAGDLEAAIRNYFSYRRWAMHHAVRNLLREGRGALVVGLGFLVACSLLSQLLPEVGVISYPLSEGLLIAGWVAMWRPIEIFLYEWRPLHRRMRNFDRLAAMPVEVRGSR